MRLSLTATKSRSLPSAKIEILKAAIIAFFLGSVLIYGIGFADMDSVHDAAHDSRHALSFPCH
jgi:cobalt transporter subunit CbtB